MQSDNDLFKEFINFLKYIYTSKLIKDIYYLSLDFKDFLFPFDDEEILDELFETTIFLPFPNDPLLGFTQKERPSVLIPVNLKQSNPSLSNFSEIICQLSQIINTCLHEHLKHYIKTLIFYNSFPLGLNGRIGSNLSEINEERDLINRILIKNNNNSSILLDGGEKDEVLLYGNVLKNIYFGQALELFKYDNWQKSIPEHIQNFINCKNNKKKNEDICLEEIIADNELCLFYKLLVKKFIEHFRESKRNIVNYNYQTFSAKMQEGVNNEAVKEGFIRYDYSCNVNFERGKIRDASC